MVPFVLAELHSKQSFPPTEVFIKIGLKENPSVPHKKSVESQWHCVTPFVPSIQHLAHLDLLHYGLSKNDRSMSTSVLKSM